MKPFKLSIVRKQLPFKISNGTSLDSIKELAENHFGDVIDFDVYLPSIGKNLQRPLVWNLFQKQQLILSILKGQVVPNLAIIHYKKEAGNFSRIIKVIDGKQRLSSIISFYKNEFPIIVEGEEYFFKDLDEEGKFAIAHLGLTANVAYEYEARPISDDDKIAWFEQINFAGTPQDIEHLNNLKK